jgi:hypothetical protein
MVILYSSDLMYKKGGWKRRDLNHPPVYKLKGAVKCSLSDRPLRGPVGGKEGPKPPTDIEKQHFNA